MKTWATTTATHLKVAMRDWEVLFWNFGFPLIFFFVFTGIFARGSRQGVLLMLPGQLCCTAMSVCCYGQGIGLVQTREAGVFRRYRLSPISPRLILGSELVYGFALAFASLMLQLVLAKTIYGVTIVGNFGAMLVMLAVGSLAFLALGFIIASVAKNVKTAPAMASVFFFPMMFLGGATMPVRMMPPAVQEISKFLPSRYMVDGLQSIIVSGNGLDANLGNLGFLAGVFAVGFGLASVFFRWE